MKGGHSNLPAEKPDLANLDSTDLSTNQEAQPVPWHTGEMKFALRWISPIYNQFTKNAPTEVPSKK